MRWFSLASLPLVLLVGCAGQLRDFVGPVSNITSPQLLRFGLPLAQARCVGERLGDTLTPRQLRMFARAAGAVRQGGDFADLTRVAATMADTQVAPALRRADEACAAGAPTMAGRQTPDGETEPGVIILGPGQLPPPSGAPAGAAGAVAGSAMGGARVPTWLNLGAAGSGQSIAIDASTIVQAESRREAWFRLTDPGATGPSLDTFLLAIDCAHRTINAKARRRTDAAGGLADYREYPDNPLPVEGGTVMEIAWLSLCT